MPSVYRAARAYLAPLPVRCSPMGATRSGAGAADGSGRDSATARGDGASRGSGAGRAAGTAAVAQRGAVTLADVAKRAKVSPATASRVINGSAKPVAEE